MTFMKQFFTVWFVIAVVVLLCTKFLPMMVPLFKGLGLAFGGLMFLVVLAFGAFGPWIVGISFAIFAVFLFTEKDR